MFSLSPGLSDGRLLCEFRVESTPSPLPVETRWEGAGTKHDWTTPTLGNVPAGAHYNKYQLKPATMNPKPPNDEVTFEVRFYLEGGLHGGRWRWPLEQHKKGFWRIEPQKGTGVSQPRLEDIWQSVSPGPGPELPCGPFPTHSRRCCSVAPFGTV